MKQSMSGISRRSFLSGMGVAAAGAAVAGLAGCAPQAASSTTEEATETTATSSEDWLGSEPTISDSDVESEESTDVVVVGLSDSGCVAVRSAAEAGASVIAIEKSETINSCGEDAAVIGGNTQAVWGRENIVPHDVIIEAHDNECGYAVKQSIMRRFVEESGSFFDWFVGASENVYIAPNYTDDIPDEHKENFIVPSYYPLPESYDWQTEAYPCFPTTVNMSNLKALLQAQMDAAEATGNVTTYFGHFAEKLIMEDGACTGVYVRNAETGKYKKITAAKGVILCTGDYSSNDAMVAHFTPSVINNNLSRRWVNVDVEGNNTNMGDGLKMAAWAGAKIQEHHTPMIHNMGGGAKLNNGVGVMGINGYLQLNKDGKRFVNEDIPGCQLETQIEMQRDMTTFQIFDSAWTEQIDKFPAAHGNACYLVDELPTNNTAFLKSARSVAQMEKFVEDGVAYKADTLEELLDQLEGINKEEALKSIERYNELCAAGVDEDFGKPAKRLFALENPPYYAAQLQTANVLVCLGGVESDEECHAYNTNREVIDGLYVAGNMQGDRFAYVYPISLKGASVGMATFYGYVAGQSAAAGA